MYAIRSYYGAGVVDIMSHLFEQYFTPDKGAFLQDAIAEGILKTCIHYGPIVLADGSNYEARANLMWASSIALNGLTVTGKYYGDWAVITSYSIHYTKLYEFSGESHSRKPMNAFGRTPRH